METIPMLFFSVFAFYDSYSCTDLLILNIAFAAPCDKGERFRNLHVRHCSCKGWNIYDDNSSTLKVGPQGKFSLNVRTMIAERGGTKQFVLFWYQAYDKGLNRTFIQKLTVTYNKIFRHKGDSAFMRIVLKIDRDDIDKARSAAEEFLNDFYPEFIDFVKS